MGLVWGIVRCTWDPCVETTDRHHVRSSAQERPRAGGGDPGVCTVGGVVGGAEEAGPHQWHRRVVRGVGGKGHYQQSRRWVLPQSEGQEVWGCCHRTPGGPARQGPECPRELALQRPLGAAAGATLGQTALLRARRWEGGRPSCPRSEQLVCVVKRRCGWGAGGRVCVFMYKLSKDIHSSLSADGRSQASGRKERCGALPTSPRKWGVRGAGDSPLAQA